MTLEEMLEIADEYDDGDGGVLVGALRNAIGYAEDLQLEVLELANEVSRLRLAHHRQE